MPTSFIPIRNDNAYFAVGKQSAQYTPVAPTNFIRWLDGSALEPDMKTEDIWEGDGSRRLSQVIKNGQKWKVKLKFSPRPGELAFFEAFTMGSGSDTYTAPTTNITLNAIAHAGDSSLSVNAGAADAAFAIATVGTVVLIIDPGLATEEAAVFITPVVGNTPPYTIQVSATYNGGHLKYGHAVGAVIQSPAIHVLTDQADSSYFTTEVCIGGLNSAGGETFRLRDCKVNSLKRSSDKGKVLDYEMEIVGLACAVQATPSTVILENRQLFLFTYGTWTLNGATGIGDPTAIEKFSIEQKNALDEDIQSQHLYNEALTFGHLDIAVDLDLIFTNMAIVNQTYFGSSTGTADAQVIALGSVAVTFAQPDGFHSVTYLVPSMAYKEAKPPAPKTDGKHYTVAVKAQGTSNQGANAYMIQTTVNNVVASSY